MTFSASIDPRLVPACLATAGLGPAGVEAATATLLRMLSGWEPSPASSAYMFNTSAETVSATLTLSVLWDAIGVSIDAEHDAGFAAALQKFSDQFDAPNQELTARATAVGLLFLNKCVQTVGASVDDLRRGLIPISLPVAQTLIDFQRSSYDRVIHEEIATFMTKPVREKSARLLLGQFLLTQFPLPAKRTHRFVLCQALINLAEPELAEDLAKLALDPQYASLRGRLCDALAKTRHPDAAQTIAAVLENGDDETKLCAIEALGRLKATQYAERLRTFATYQSADKEWTRAIKKAAEKALKAM